MDIYIEIKHTQETLFIKNRDTVFNLDTGPLALQETFRIGLNGKVYKPIECYAHRVVEYDLWLRDKIAKVDKDICAELDKIFQQAQKEGAVLANICMPSPYVTHAHKVRDIIMELAASLQ